MRDAAGPLQVLSELPKARGPGRPAPEPAPWLSFAETHTGKTVCGTTGVARLCHGEIRTGNKISPAWGPWVCAWENSVCSLATMLRHQGGWCVPVIALLFLEGAHFRAVCRSRP